MAAMVKISEWPCPAMDDLVDEGTHDGFRFLSRLKQDWLSGVNRFSAEGEAFFGVFEGKELIAVGGVNRQSADCGRIRRVYVRKAYRRKGIGSKLVRHILDFAARHYRRVMLRTDTEVACAFYRAMGFVRVTANDDATHGLEFGNRRTRDEGRQAWR